MRNPAEQLHHSLYLNLVTTVLLSNITDGADTNGGACTRVVQTFKRNVAPHMKGIIMECVVTKRNTSDSIATNNLGHRYET